MKHNKRARLKKFWRSSIKKNYRPVFLCDKRMWLTRVRCTLTGKPFPRWYKRKDRLFIERQREIFYTQKFVFPSGRPINREELGESWGTLE